MDNGILYSWLASTAYKSYFHRKPLQYIPTSRGSMHTYYYRRCLTVILMQVLYPGCSVSRKITDMTALITTMMLTTSMTARQNNNLEICLQHVESYIELTCTHVDAEETPDPSINNAS